MLPSAKCVRWAFPPYVHPQTLSEQSWAASMISCVVMSFAGDGMTLLPFSTSDPVSEWNRVHPFWTHWGTWQGTKHPLRCYFSKINKVTLIYGRGWQNKWKGAFCLFLKIKLGRSLSSLGRWLAGGLYDKYSVRDVFLAELTHQVAFTGKNHFMKFYAFFNKLHLLWSLPGGPDI